MLVKPQTFMNDSGKSVRALVEKDGLDPVDVLVVYDDLDLPVGRIRIRGAGLGRRARGHQVHPAAAGRRRAPKRRAGAWRWCARAAAETPCRAAPAPSRGAGARPAGLPPAQGGDRAPPAGVDPIEFVLTTFVPDELTLIRPAVERAADAVECWLAEGADVAANRFNGV